jgi:carboxymethylenebutenolidase
MCFDLDSHPPIPPLAGAAVDGHQTTLKASDGTEFLAYDAHASEPTGAGVVIFPDVRGLHPFFEELALRFAERGVDAVAIDYFGRTAETKDRGESFEYMPHVDKIDYRTTMLDAAAARDELVERGVRHVFTVGFCMGGRLAFLTGAEDDLDLSGVIGFYGGPTGQGRGGMPAPLELAEAGKFRSPVLGLFGGADKGIPESAIVSFGDALTAAGIDNEMVIYPGAPHSFFDRKADEFQQASEDAWVKLLEFIDRETAGTAQV